MAIKITNKDVIQSYLMTVSKYNFSVYEKRILYRLVEAMQCEIEGKKLYPGLRIEKTLYDDRVVLMPISAFLANDDDENYTRVKKALLDLRNKSFEFDDGQVWKVIGIIEKPQFNYKRGWVRFEIQPEVYNAVLNFSKGFRKYELKTAMEFTSQYSMRFYELMSGQERPLIYSIEDLKIMFGVQDKYKRNPDFIKWIVKPAKEELDTKSPYSFEYKVLKDGRSFHSLKLYPKYQPEHRDEELEKHELQKQVSLGWDLDRLIRNYLKQELLFTDQEIRNNIDLFRVAQKELDLMLELSTLKGKSRDKNHEINKFEQENQRHPSVSELSEVTKLDEEKIGQSLAADGHHVSIDAPFQDGEDNCMLDVMPSGEDSRTDRAVDHESMALELNTVLSKVLKEREITIIRECFGIGCHEKGLEEIGDQLGLTRERVRQIREKSIAKLRESGNAKILMKYLG